MSDTNIKQSNNALSARRERQSQKKATREAVARRARRKKILHIQAMSFPLCGISLADTMPAIKKGYD